MSHLFDHELALYAANLGLTSIAKAGDWEEDKHPRGEGGRFGSGGGGGGSKDGAKASGESRWTADHYRAEANKDKAKAAEAAKAGDTAKEGYHLASAKTNEMMADRQSRTASQATAKPQVQPNVSAASPSGEAPDERNWLGATESGKEVYRGLPSDHPHYANFTPSDHAEASAMHRRLGNIKLSSEHYEHVDDHYADDEEDWGHE